MQYITNQPLLVVTLSFLGLWASAWIGKSVIRRRYAIDDEIHDDLGIILGAALTLLALLVGFSFSMATSRYDQRKNYEEAEANAIGTEFLRSDLLPAADRAKVRPLLKTYLDQRIAFYLALDSDPMTKIDASTAETQGELWAAILPATTAQPTPIAAVVVSGMNDVINSQGYTQAAWWNRIPTAAWSLMAAMAVGCNVLVGYKSRASRDGFKFHLILPLFFSVAFMLIAEIDTPRAGLIRVIPQNLATLAESLKSS